MFFVFKHPRKPKTMVIVEITLPGSGPAIFQWKLKKEYVGDFYRWLWLWFSVSIVPGWSDMNLTPKENVERTSRKASLIDASDMISEGGPVDQDGGFRKSLDEWDDNQKKAQAIIDTIPDRPVEGK